VYVYPHVMLHPPAKFRSNQMNIGGLLTSYRFFNGGHRVEINFQYQVTVFVQNGENLFAYQISR